MNPALRRLGLLLPATGFLVVFFVLPLAWLFSLAVREAEVPRALPRTLAGGEGFFDRSDIHLAHQFAYELPLPRECATSAYLLRGLNRVA